MTHHRRRFALPPAAPWSNYEMNSAGVLDPAGPVAAASSDVAWWMFIGGGLIFLLVIALTLAAWRAFIAPFGRGSGSSAGA